MASDQPTTLASSHLKTRYFTSWFNERGSSTLLVPRLCELVVSRVEQLNPFEQDIPASRSEAPRPQSFSIVVSMEVMCAAEADRRARATHYGRQSMCCPRTSAWTCDSS